PPPRPHTQTSPHHSVPSLQPVAHTGDPPAAASTPAPAKPAATTPPVAAAVPSPPPHSTRRSACRVAPIADPPAPRSHPPGPSCSPPESQASPPASANPPPVPCVSGGKLPPDCSHRSAKYPPYARARASARCAAENPAPDPPPHAPLQSAQGYPPAPAAAPHR